jgi:hypothetical protein
MLTSGERLMVVSHVGAAGSGAFGSHKDSLTTISGDRSIVLSLVGIGHWKPIARVACARVAAAAPDAPLPATAHNNAVAVTATATRLPITRLNIEAPPVGLCPLVTSD